MRKLLTLTAALLMGASLMNAQDYDYEYEGTNAPGFWNISVQGGILGSLSENAFTFNDHGYFGKLVTPQASISVGYEFNETYSVRLNLGYGKNMSACNALQTYQHHEVYNENGKRIGGFWPYGFMSVNGFVDVILNFNGLAGINRKFAPKLYGGLGLGHGFGFWLPEYSEMHDQDIIDFVEAQSQTNDPCICRFNPTTAFKPYYVDESTWAPAFRFGFIAQYDFTDTFGIYADISGECYHDSYNGWAPSAADFKPRQGYPGFPLDLRGLISFGVSYRFK